jgi:hypothetical protein
MIFAPGMFPLRNCASLAQRETTRAWKVHFTAIAKMQAAVSGQRVFRGVDLDAGAFLLGGAPAVSVPAPQVNHRLFISGQADTGSKLIALFEDRLQSLSNPLEIISTESVHNHGVCLFEEIGSLKNPKVDGANAVGVLYAPCFVKPPVLHTRRTGVCDGWRVNESCMGTCESHRRRCSSKAYWVLCSGRRSGRSK